MKTVVAETVMLGREAFETLGDVDVIPDRQIGPQHLVGADALIIRSKTKVTPELLEGSSVRFIGTATAGFEHIDFQWLEKNKIRWTAAPGCNADSVADYITAALLRLPLDLENKTIGIIGVGQVGSRVAKRAKALGLRVLLNDPPREAREVPPEPQAREAGTIAPATERSEEANIGNNRVAARDSFPNLGTDCVGAGDSFPDSGKKSSNGWKNQAERFQSLENRKSIDATDFQRLEKLLAESDIITMHVPAITAPPWPTVKMADDAFFNQMKHGSVFINASRGKVVDSDALLHAKENGIVSHAVLDVWDPEPSLRTDMVELADIGTPHIAGYSLEGKLNGTLQVYREACRFFGFDPVWDPAPLLPAVAVPELKIDSRGKTDNEVLAEVVASVYDIMADDAALRSATEKFDFLRANYGVRREFFNTRVMLSEDRPTLKQKLCTLGFST